MSIIFEFAFLLIKDNFIKYLEFLEKYLFLKILNINNKKLK